MSTKFSGLPKTQKPPAVCKKPPVPDTDPSPPFNEHTFQAYAEWFDPEGSNRMQVTGDLVMLPNPPANTWTGRTPGKPFVIQVDMEWHASLQAIDVTITLLLDGVPTDAYQDLLLPVRSVDPFDSGLVIMTQTPGQVRANCRIMT